MYVPTYHWKVWNWIFPEVQALVLLKELRNCYLCIICVWIVFSPVRVNMSLHFLPILLKDWVSVFLCFEFSVSSIFWIWCPLHRFSNICKIIQVPCDFVPTFQKRSIKISDCKKHAAREIKKKNKKRKNKQKCAAVAKITWLRKFKKKFFEK